jgi:hypothetical protein
MAIKIAGTEVINDDKELVLAKLTDIDASIADTAVDVFVYDTRKDSDGGAWRKRTQHTSWYNETLNTSTRGSRKEFPAVAVIVAESGKVTIYDGDDPDLPMWMVFTEGYSAYLGTIASAPVSSVMMLNGIMAHGAVYDLHVTNFLKDNNFRSGPEGISPKHIQNIANRNDDSGGNFQPDSTIPIIVNRAVNDVAMTVLPNAPIDSATGLPVPTIAVATNGGVSVIKDDGTVVDISSVYVCHSVAIDKNGTLTIALVTGNGDWVGTYPLPTSDHTHNDNYITRIIDNGWSSYHQYIGSVWKPRDLVVLPNDYIGIGGDSGINFYTKRFASPRYGGGEDSPSAMFADITSSYNTGWMNGDIKLATLSDTDDTDVTGGDLVSDWRTNFTDDSSGSNTVVYDSANDRIIGTEVDGSCIYTHNGFATVVGETYTLTVNVTSGTTMSVNVIRADNDVELADYAGTGPFVAKITFVAESTTTYFNVLNNNTFTFDSADCYLIQEDRSVKSNGLQVFGTVTKNPVATGADLVAYSGFSTSNYLEQPYNSDLDFGTGDFCAMGWFKSNTTTGGNQPLFWRGQTDTNSYAMIEPYITADGSVDVLTRNAAETYTILQTSTNILTQNWIHWCMVRVGGVMQWYVNGKLDAQAANTQDVTPSTPAKGKLEIGSDWTKVSKALPGSAALFRISATAPSAEQIAKIYEDEKVLFQENAQATLYGSSDSVTALAYDDDTELLHVGTSAGRSDFSGLRRVSNTTDAVGAAISASNGLIAED